MGLDLDTEVENTLVPLTEKLEKLSTQVARFIAKMRNVDEDQARRVSFTLSVVKPKDNIVTKLTLSSFPRGAVTCVKLVMGVCARLRYPYGHSLCAAPAAGCLN